MAQQRHLRSQYKKRFSLVKESIVSRDPLGLIASGAPTDEYDEEVARILVILPQCGTPEELGDKIGAIFQDSFGGDITREAMVFKELARDILVRARKVEGE
jgi:hypothetical protein